MAQEHVAFACKVVNLPIEERVICGKPWQEYQPWRTPHQHRVTAARPIMNDSFSRVELVLNKLGHAFLLEVLLEVITLLLRCKVYYQLCYSGNAKRTIPFHYNYLITRNAFYVANMQS